ncbi:DUF397 domain-containing protein [Streptomyces sp. NBC_00988]|uniref:DUF397 domain-containing protein n=1 Tax=Streptomyces sp. NBC_00988 TaxID=2903704 RepID=UPI003864B739|nr:DUF397 domain-containing protein [Streptomyces sp. NBC_00988]
MTRLGTTIRSTGIASEGTWFKSSYSSQDGGNCVEIAAQADGVGVRDTKSTDGPAVFVSGAAFTSFIQSLSA